MAQIVELLNIIYCLAQLVEFFAFLHLRVKLPHLPRCCLCTPLAIITIINKIKT